MSPVPHADGQVVYEFGGFRLDLRHRTLARVSGGAIAITDKAFDCLAYLVENAGQLVTKEQLTKALWPVTVVEESNLYVTISALRKALQDDASRPGLIATIAGRGYQFVGEVRRIPVDAPVAPTNPSTTRSSQSPGHESGTRRWGPILAAGLALVAAIGFGAYWYSGQNAGPVDSQDAVVTLAVLPFRPLTSGDRNESLELGMTETLIAGLNSARLRVSPLSSVRKYSGIEADGLAAGRQLGVQAVLEGHIQRVGDRLRVSARLVNVGDGRQLWAESSDHEFTDIFSVQDSIAGHVRASLLDELTVDAQPALRRYTRDTEAYQLYANGRFYLDRLNEPALRQALGYFSEAVRRDPQFALGYVGISEAHSILGVIGAVAPDETYPQARQAAERAIALAPELGDAHASLGHVKMQFEHDWPGAERAFRRAIELKPTYARAHQFLGLNLAYRGRFEDGIEQLRRAQTLEPAWPGYSALIGMVLVYERRYDEAIEQLLKTLEMDPDFPTTNTYLTFAYLRRGDYDRARQQLQRVRSFAPGSTGYAGQIHALSGETGAARAELERLRTLSRDRYVSAYDLATIHAALGDVDETFEWLERAIEERSTLIGWLPWEPVFDDIRSDPRYLALMRRLETTGTPLRRFSMPLELPKLPSPSITIAPGGAGVSLPQMHPGAGA
jgi:DNA-binding winged helix-turn-helix (wHTH) protein/TolB-like protein/Flp pilus assembly protein TadD